MKRQITDGGVSKTMSQKKKKKGHIVVGTTIGKKGGGETQIIKKKRRLLAGRWSSPFKGRGAKSKTTRQKLHLHLGRSSLGDRKDAGRHNGSGTRRGKSRKKKKKKGGKQTRLCWAHRITGTSFASRRQGQKKKAEGKSGRWMVIKGFYDNRDLEGGKKTAGGKRGTGSGQGLGVQGTNRSEGWVKNEGCLSPQ